MAMNAAIASIFTAFCFNADCINTGTSKTDYVRRVTPQSASPRRLVARQPRHPATGKVATWLPTWVATLPQTWQVAWQPGIIADGTLLVTHLAEPIPQFDRIKVCLPSTARPWSSSHQALFWEMICPEYGGGGYMGAPIT